MKKTNVLRKNLPKKVAKRKNSSVIKEKIKKINVSSIEEISPNINENNFLYYNNEVLNDIDSFLKDAEINYSPNFLDLKKEVIENKKTIEDPTELDEIEKIIKQDAADAEFLRQNFNYKIKIGDNDSSVLGSVSTNKNSQHVINLRDGVQKGKNINQDLFFDIPKKKTLRSVSDSYFKEISKILLKNKFVKLVYFLGEGTNNFFIYSLYPVKYIAKGIVNASVSFVASVDMLGRGVYKMFVVSEKKPKNRYREIKLEVSKIEPSKLFKSSGFKFYRKLFAFVISSILIIIIINFSAFVNKLNETKGRVLGISEQAYQSLESGIRSMVGYDFENAETNFSNANQKFKEAENEISQNGEVINQILKLIPNQGKQIDYGEKLIETGALLSESAVYINSALKEQDGLTITQKIQLIYDNLYKCRDSLKLAGKNISEIDESVLPQEYREKFKLMKNKFPLLASNIDRINSLFDVTNQILGSDGMKRYLLLFQNNNEIRPTGGFIGSIAIVDIKQGEIQNIIVPPGGPYDYRAGITDSFIAPKPMWLINPNFYFWDMNWWVDAPISYSTIAENFERAGGQTVDGVISINSDLMLDVLKLTGPVHIDEYNLDITENNFYKEIQEIVEFKYDKEENKPKKVIGEMMQKILDRLFNDKNLNYVEIVKLFDIGVSSKDIQMYFSDSSLEAFVDNYGWSGSVRETDKDYLSVVNTNIGGGKTDEFIKQKIYHNVEVLSNGKIIDTVRIVRKFNEVSDNFFAQATNKNYMRIYVPRGSKLLEAGGFDSFPEKDYVKPAYGSQEFGKLLELQGRVSIDKASGIEIFDELGKTTFAAWQEIRPGEEKIVYVKYELPFILSFESLQSFLNGLFKDNSNKFSSYSVIYQKQSGIEGDIEFNYKWSDSLKLIWSNLENFNSNAEFSHDFANGFILDKK
ncbi:MAG: DUF4012 domain-containing protein [Patescibacteria group bacterium]|nr:DUF4012 domain-containing protein [Patescibacteria group bacterium]